MRKLRFIALFSALIMSVTVFSGCGSKEIGVGGITDGNVGGANLDGGSSEENNGNEKEDGFVYEINDVGNHPNNLYQNPDHTIAFDEDYIYFTSYYRTGKIYRSDHSGNNIELFHETKGGVIYLNCYKGNVYYCDLESNNKTIFKVDTSTKAVKEIYKADKNAQLYKMFVASDCIFYSVYEKDRDTTTVYATSCDGAGQVVLASEKGNQDDIAFYFTKDDKNLYLMEERDEGQTNVRSISLESIKNAIKTTGTVSAEASYFPCFGNKHEWMLGANGVLDFECGWTDKAVCKIYFQGFKYAKENGNPKEGTKTAQVKASEATKPKRDYVVPFGSKWEIGNSVINLGQNDWSHLGQCVDDDGTYPIYIYKDSDISKETKILSLSSKYMELATGAYKDKFYLIRFGEESNKREDSCLYVIDENGIVSQTEMTIPVE